MRVARTSPWLEAQTLMRLLDLTLGSAAENLALDEALLEDAEAAGGAREVLRFWESPHLAVVAGRSTRVREEIDLEHCARRRIPVVRRCSGGASVVIGPGCLLYSLVLSYELRPALRMIEEAHEFVLESMARALGGPCGDAVRKQGTSDLTRGSRKISGNSMRCKRTHFLYHGTLLYDFPLALIGQCLRAPPRQPEYRGGRDHGAFVANLPIASDVARERVREVWRAEAGRDDWPRALTRRLARDRYEQDAWNLRR